MDSIETTTYLEGEKVTYKDSTHDLISKVAYLIGIPKRIFENENEPPKLDVYERLDKDKSARIIRHLCIIRASIERNFKAINDKMRREICSILSMPEYIPSESINQLTLDGVSFYKKSNTQLCQQIIALNRLISDRINNCKQLFPIWINWNYIRDLFIMPNGLTENGTKAAAEQYYANKSAYPYQMYINWKPREEGNILYNDKKFVTLLYEWNHDYFGDLSKVSDASDYVKGNIYDYISESKKVIVMVDCENSDPYSLYATLNNLDDEYTSKILKIILINDTHTSTAWDDLGQYVKIPVEPLLAERVKVDKSMVDGMLMVRTTQEHYVNNVDSVILVSSDCDYWGMISLLKDVRFLVMIEHDKCGPDMKNKLEDAGIFYCYIDDFYSANSEQIKMQALFKEMHRYLNNAVSFNVNDMFDEALKATRIFMTTAERRQFYDKHIKRMSLVIGEDGDVRIELNR